MSARTDLRENLPGRIYICRIRYIHSRGIMCKRERNRRGRKEQNGHRRN